MAFFFLVIYTIALFIRPHEWVIFGLGETSVIMYSLAICLPIFAIHKKKNLDIPQVTLLLMLTIAIFLSMVFSGWTGGGIMKSEDFIRTALIPFVLINAFLETRKKQYVMCGIIIITSLIMVSNGYVQVNSPDGLGWVGNPVYTNGSGELLRIKYVGMFEDPNDMGMFLVMTIPLVFLFLQKAPRSLRFVLWGCVAALLYGIYLTNSRGTLLAVLAIAAVWFWRRYGTKRSIYLGLLVLPVLVLVLSKFRAIDSQEESAQGRLDAWYAGIEMFISSPVFGIGKDNFIEYHSRTAHNSFVLAFAELGLFGSMIWVGLIASTCIILIRIVNKKYVPAGLDANDPRWIEIEEEARIAKAFLYCFLAYGVSAFFLSRTYVPTLYFFLGMATATYCRIKYLFPTEVRAVYTNKELFMLASWCTVLGIILVYVLIKVGL